MSINKYRLGMLWCGLDNHEDMYEIIQNGLTYYQEKYEEVPNLIHVHPDHKPIAIPNVKVKYDPQVQKYNVWIGVD